VKKIGLIMKECYATTATTTTATASYVHPRD